ncbi:MAG: hypothetical protein EOO28_36225 [Comamonadaceae bacterium]|nr:MAG: hypothetical protein EOO28_36225 [Comamonadaceae bacterium]
MPFHIAATRSERLTRMGRLAIGILLIVVLEGGVRKWLASSATLPLILLRDAMAAYGIFYAVSRGACRRQGAVTTILLLWTACVVGWGLLQLMLDQSNWGTYLIGLRFWLLYIWFGFAAACAMSEHDYKAATRVALGLLLVLVPLVALQYASAPGAFINRQVDGDESDIFLLVAGIVRPAATFSFTAGYVTFLAFIAPLVLSLVHLKKRNLRQLVFTLLVFMAFVVGSLMSGSRFAIISSAAMVALYVASTIIFTRGAKRARTLFVALVSVLLLVLVTFALKDVVSATQQRFEAAAEAEDFASRVLSMFIGEENIYAQFNWLGYGIGKGSNLASFFAQGQRTFVLAETETGRTLLEGGLLGYAFVALKMFLGSAALLKALSIARGRAAILPILMWASLLFAALTWSATGQLTVNAMFGLLLAFGLLSLRFPETRPLR